MSSCSRILSAEGKLKTKQKLMKVYRVRLLLLCW
jgi:hypothetical protein